MAAGPCDCGWAIRILVDTGEMGAIRFEDRERAIEGRIHNSEEGLAKLGLKQEEIEMRNRGGSEKPQGIHVRSRFLALLESSP